MFLTRLILENFRNFSDIDIKFDRQTILIIGENAQGKTNLLESIFFISSGKSHRTNSLIDLIKWDSNYALIRAFVSESPKSNTKSSPKLKLNDNVNLNLGKNDKKETNIKEKSKYEKTKDDNTLNEHLIEVEIRPENKYKIKVDGVYCKKKSDFIFILPSVIFSPDDLSIIKGSPSNRREFLDDILERINPSYPKLKLNYQKILEQRNTLLKTINISGKNFNNNYNHNNNNYNSSNNTNFFNNNLYKQTLDAWNENLAKYGSEIIYQRIKLLSEISKYFEDYLNNFFQDLKARIIYNFSWQNLDLQNMQINFQDKNLLSSNDFVNFDSDNLSNLNNLSKLSNLQFFEQVKNVFLLSLKLNLNKELNYKSTLIGPHRDDFTIELGGRNVKLFGSQGQQRVATICLKLCEVKVIENTIKKAPILLFDDILSELDQTRELAVINTVANKYQTFITTSNLSFLNSFNEISNITNSINGANDFNNDNDANSVNNISDISKLNNVNNMKSVNNINDINYIRDVTYGKNINNVKIFKENNDASFVISLKNLNIKKYFIQNGLVKSD